MTALNVLAVPLVRPLNVVATPGWVAALMTLVPVDAVTLIVVGSTPPVVLHVLGPYHLNGTVADPSPTAEAVESVFHDIAEGVRFPMMEALV